MNERKHSFSSKSPKELTAPPAWTPYVFDHYTDALQSFHSYRKSSDSRAWSLGAWAKRLNISSSGALINYMKARAIPSLELSQRIVESMKLGHLESEYMLTLFEIARQRSSLGTVQIALARKIAALRNLAATDSLSTRRFELVSRPHHLVIREMVMLKGFKEDSEWISERLQHSVDEVTIKASIENLIFVGLLERAADGHLRLTHPFTDTAVDVPSEATKQYQEAACEMARQAVRNTPLCERHITSNVFAFRKDRLPEIKAYLSSFRDELNGLFDTQDGSADSVYQLNLQLFPVAQSEKINPKPQKPNEDI